MGKKYEKRSTLFSRLRVIGGIVLGTVAISGIVAETNATNVVTMERPASQSRAGDIPRPMYGFGLGREVNQGPVQNVDVLQDIILKKMGKLTLYIPSGFIAPVDGYRRDYDLVELWALLPCFEPLDRDNASEFHKVILDRVIKIRITSGERLNVGQPMLNTLLQDSVKKTDQPQADDYVVFNRGFGSEDLFVFQPASSVLYLSCDVPTQYLRWPHCRTSKRIWQDTSLEYYFERKFMANDTDHGLKIDEGVASLLNGFLKPDGKAGQSIRGKHCDQSS